MEVFPPLDSTTSSMTGGLEGGKLYPTKEQRSDLMNLKDGFRFQNKLEALMEEACDILHDRRNILKVKTTHLRSQVSPEEKDVEVEETRPSDYAGQATALAAFLMALLGEREKLAAAIHDAKAKLDIDMDSQVGLNRVRQQLAATLRQMTACRSGEKILPGGGTGYRFNSEGNQVTYRCDAKVVTTIDFDRGKVKAMAVELSQKADAVSAQLDRCLVNGEVAYEPPFDVNDSFDELFTAFLEKA